MERKHYALLAAAVLGLLIVPFLATESSASAEVGFVKNAEVSPGFNDMGGGSITVFLYNKGVEEKKVTVVVMDGDVKKASKTLEIPKRENSVDGRVDVTLGLSYGSPGNKTVDVVLYDGEGGDGAVELQREDGVSIHVAHSIWKDTTTYILIIIVIAVIGVAIYLKARGNPLKKSKKEEVSFAELNRARSEGRGGRRR